MRRPIELARCWLVLVGLTLILLFQLIARGMQMFPISWMNTLSAIAVDPQSVDLGSVSIGSKIRKVFRVTNRSDALITLRPPITSCRCVVTKLSRNVLRPGESLDVHCTLSVQDVPGDFTTPLILTAIEIPQVTEIAISGTAVVRNWSYPRKLIMFVDERGRAEGRVRLLHPKVPFINNAVAGEADRLRLALIPLNGHQTLLDVAIDKAWENGQSDILVFSKGHTIPLLSVPVTWERQPDFIIQPKTLYISAATTSRAAVVRRSVFLLPRRDNGKCRYVSRVICGAVRVSIGRELAGSRAIEFDVDIDLVRFQELVDPSDAVDAVELSDGGGQTLEVVRVHRIR